MKLKAWLERENLTHGEFAERIDRTAESVRRYASGERIPDRDTMPRIVRETGGAVTANDFFDLDEAPQPAEPERALLREPSGRTPPAPCETVGGAGQPAAAGSDPQDGPAAAGDGAGETVAEAAE